MTNSNHAPSRLKERLELSATILLIVVTLLVAGITLWDRLHPQPTGAAHLEPPLPPAPVSIDGAPVRGNRSARVALIEFSDFECPYCASFGREVLPEIDRQYLRTGKVILVWRHFPLAFHPNALKAAEAAECAGRQGKFWEFHDWAVLHEKSLDHASVRIAATTIGLEPAAFDGCLDGQATAKVRADVALGDALSVGGTPTLLIGVVQSDGKVRVIRRLTGAGRLGDIKNAIDKVIVTVAASGQ